MLGGVAGYNGGSLSDCYNAGPVSGSGTYVGGVAGENESTGSIANCYFDTDVSLTAAGAGYDGTTTSSVTGQTTAGMMTAGFAASLGTTFTKRPADPAYCYYPELAAFYNDLAVTDSDKASKASVTVARKVVDIEDILGVNIPGAGIAAVAAITQTEEYTGSVTWNPVPVGGVFAAGASYTATIALSLASDLYTFAGLPANFFTVNGATATNAANGSVVTAVFPVAGTLPVITTTSLADGAVSAAYSQTIAATGDAPITWGVSGGSLPGGLTLNASTGEISGTPTTAGTYTFQARSLEITDTWWEFSCES